MATTYPEPANAMEQSTPPAHEQAERQLTAFVEDMQGRLAGAEKAQKALEGERDKADAEFNRRQRAIQKAIDMCRAALQQVEGDKPTAYDGSGEKAEF